MVPWIFWIAVLTIFVFPYNYLMRWADKKITENPGYHYTYFMEMCAAGIIILSALGCCYFLILWAAHISGCVDLLGVRIPGLFR
jgi:hypothetical protein